MSCTLLLWNQWYMSLDVTKMHRNAQFVPISVKKKLWGPRPPFNATLIGI